MKRITLLLIAVVLLIISCSDDNDSPTPTTGRYLQKRYLYNYDKENNSWGEYNRVLTYTLNCSLENYEALFWDQYGINFIPLNDLSNQIWAYEEMQNADAAGNVEASESRIIENGRIKTINRAFGNTTRKIEYYTENGKLKKVDSYRNGELSVCTTFTYTGDYISKETFLEATQGKSIGFVNYYRDENNYLTSMVAYTVDPIDSNIAHETFRYNYKYNSKNMIQEIANTFHNEYEPYNIEYDSRDRIKKIFHKINSMGTNEEYTTEFEYYDNGLFKEVIDYINGELNFKSTYTFEKL
jgi:hypothetical protein